MKITRFAELPSFILAAALGASLSLSTPAIAFELPFLVDLKSNTMTGLESLPGYGYFTNVEAINNAGQVVGYSSTSGNVHHAFITGPNGVGTKDLSTLVDGTSSEAYGINDAGQVVGSWGGHTLAITGSVNEFGQVVGSRGGHAFITDPNGTGMRDLGTLGGTYSRAYDINDAGQVVGESMTADGATHAFITGPNGVGMRDLGTLGGRSSGASAINDAGQVVGSAETANGSQYAFITGPDGTGMREFFLYGIYASDINDTGQVAGLGAGGVPFITGPNGGDGMYLGSLGEIGYSSALGVNDAGQVVGYAYTPADVNRHAFIMGPDDTSIVDLNSQVHAPDGFVQFALTDAIDINNQGQIIAMALVPEPETYALMLAGLGLVGFGARRKRLAFKTYRG